MPWSLWKATDELLRRPVAVYLLAPVLVSTSGLESVVQAAARINDPRLVRIFDADLGGECPYIVTEWAPGEHLEDLLSNGALPPGIAASIIADAADVIAVAHQAGCPHLCLGPRSLHWGASGVKITGLGIHAALTGVVADDPAATDVAALARMLYALITSHWPGEEATKLPAAPRKRGRLYMPRQVRADIPDALNEITCRALQVRSPSLATPALLATALRPVADSLSRQVPAIWSPTVPVQPWAGVPPRPAGLIPALPAAGVPAQRTHTAVPTPTAPTTRAPSSDKRPRGGPIATMTGTADVICFFAHVATVLSLCYHAAGPGHDRISRAILADVSIGETLAQARDHAGLTAAEVSAQTRIRESLIRSIERDEFDACGGDFYARGHIRAIATAVGIDSQALIREYDEARPSARPVTLDDLLSQPSQHAKRAPNWMWLGVVVLLAVIGVIAYQLASSAPGSPKPVSAERAAATRPEPGATRSAHTPSPALRPARP